MSDAVVGRMEDTLAASQACCMELHTVGIRMRHWEDNQHEEDNRPGEGSRPGEDSHKALSRSMGEELA